MSSPNRKQRRVSEKRNRKSSGEARVLPTEFRVQYEALAVIGGFANHVSMTQTGLPTTTSGWLASMVFAKCCAHARSIGAIAVQSSMFDHHAIMSLARMILEGSTMLAYLLDAASPDEWSLRYDVLKLHDTTTRIKLLRGFNRPADDLRAGRDELKAMIGANPEFLRLSEDRRKRLLGGEEMFVIGMRSVAIKIMGWEESQLTAVYAYFSAHTHSAPMSFMRTADHKIDYFFPSEKQIAVLTLSMEVAIACLRRSTLRMIAKHPEQISEYHPGILTETRELDASVPFFKGGLVL